MRHRAGGGWGRVVEMTSAFDRESVAVESGYEDVWIAWRRQQGGLSGIWYRKFISAL